MIICLLGIAGCTQTNDIVDTNSMITFDTGLLMNGTCQLVKAKRYPQFNTLILGTTITLQFLPDGENQPVKGMIATKNNFS